MAYLWVKSLHVIFVISWMAGLFYLPRLFVYHTTHGADAKMAAVFTTMERKLIAIIVNPGGVLAVAFGVTMLGMNPSLLEMPWMRWKIAAVLGMLGFHLFCLWSARRLARGEFFLPQTRWRAINEIPTLLMFAIVILVIRKAP
jgi:putative membrane protein